MRAILLSTLLLTGCGGLSDSSSPLASADDQQVFEGPVPRATCGPGSAPETGMQGVAPTEDPGFICNMELVGHEGTRASWMMAWYDDCAYYNRDFHNDTSGDNGVVVVDVSDPANPVRTTTLVTPSMMDPHESLKVTEKRGLLAAVTGYDIGGNGPVGFEVYDVDVQEDCAHPQLQASLPMSTVGHEGNWSADGMTYYGTTLWGVTGFQAIDVSIPAAPHLLYSEDFLPLHGLSTSADGNRGYLAHFGYESVPGNPGENGLMIVDLSQIQSRTPNPQLPVIADLLWDDGGAAQMTVPVSYAGHPYVVFTDVRLAGAVRIIDIADERNPRITAKLKLEIHMPWNIEPGVEYNSHYCNVDRREDPSILACTYRADGGPSSGVRVFDIRNPHLPREIAYFNQPGAANASDLRIIKDRAEIWYTDQKRGFQVLRLTNGVWPFPEKN